MKVKKNVRSKDLIEMKKLLEVDLRATKVQVRWRRNSDSMAQIKALYAVYSGVKRGAPEAREQIQQ